MDKVDQGEADAMSALKIRVEQLTNTLNSNCTKCKARAMDKRGYELSPIVKRSKGDAEKSVAEEATKVSDDKNDVASDNTVTSIDTTIVTTTVTTTVI